MQALDFGDLWLRISGSSAEGATQEIQSAFEARFQR